MDTLFRAIFVLSCFVFVKCDTPANCTYEEVKGTWMFSMGSRGNDRTLKCDTFATASSMKITLDYPDIATDQYGNKGFWTLIYNQGFEIVVAGRKYFAFSMYKKEGMKVMSMCDKTLLGWSHDTLGRDWACFAGQKMMMEKPKRYISRDRLYTDAPYKADFEFIEKINSKQNSWKAVHYPEYEHMSIEDMIRRAGGRKSKASLPKPARPTREQILKAADLPKAFDWRNVNGMNFVSPIRNQMACGSCYAFGSLAMHEARIRIMTNGTMTPVFSTQDVVECSEYSQGCEGGFPYLIGGKYAEDFGLVAESCNPYTGRDGKCKTNPSCTRQYASRYQYIGGYYGACNEEQMMIDLVNNGPMAVAFEVYPDFQQYKGGIYKHTGLTSGYNPFEITNHAVLLVGYGVDSMSGDKYWIVKNSWGKEWGESGYFRIMKGVDECAIESIAVQSFPIICNEEAMMDKLVNDGPIAVSFMVYSDFQHYKSGIYQHTKLTSGFNPFEITNHVVLVVGYGEDPQLKQKYWIVKNSWGTEWGEKGFFRIMKGVDECSIESIAVEAFPIF